MDVDVGQAFFKPSGVSVADFPESESVVAEEYKNGVVEMVIDSSQKLFDSCVHR